MKNRSLLCIVAIGALVAELQSAEEGVDLRQIPAEHIQPSVATYPSIQAALDANPGQVVWVPAGDYPLSEAIVVHHSGSVCAPSGFRGSRSSISGMRTAGFSCDYSA